MGVTIHIGGISLSKIPASSLQQISIQYFINKKENIMKTIMRISFVIVLLCIFVLPVQAQSDRVYEDGSVWSISYIKTKPTHFDDYLKNLNDTWRKYQE
jgi:hypothetical protein